MVTPFLSPNLLHRAFLPLPSEIQGWLDTAVDLQSIEVNLAASNEFFAKG